MLRFEIPLLFRSYFSPFKPVKWRFYLGNTKIGTPVFLPRRWRNLTKAEIKQRALESLVDPKLKTRTLEEWESYYSGHMKAVPKKVGFDFVDVRWKTKWRRNDYRHEYDPVFSLVFLGYQFAIMFTAPHSPHYWECFLYYHYETKGTWKERIAQCRKESPQKWTTHSNGVDKSVDYYDEVVKKRYL